MLFGIDTMLVTLVPKKCPGTQWALQHVGQAVLEHHISPLFVSDLIAGVGGILFCPSVRFREPLAAALGSCLRIQLQPAELIHRIINQAPRYWLLLAIQRQFSSTPCVPPVSTKGCTTNVHCTVAYYLPKPIPTHLPKVWILYDVAQSSSNRKPGF